MKGVMQSIYAVIGSRNPQMIDGNVISTGKLKCVTAAGCVGPVQQSPALRVTRVMVSLDGVSVVRSIENDVRTHQIVHQKRHDIASYTLIQRTETII